MCRPPVRSALRRCGASKGARRGFTLVELMVVVAVVGILASIAVYEVSRYVTSAKTAEARNALGQIAKDAVTAFAREKMAPELLAGGGAVLRSNELCGSAHPVPAELESVASAKYQSSPQEWLEGTNLEGWRCLSFSMDEPQYFQYRYVAEDTRTSFVAIANGDLDGDGAPSTFSLKGTVGDGVVHLSPTIEEEDPDE